MQSQAESLADLGVCIRSIRKERGFTLHELAEKSDLSIAFLSRLERGRISTSMTNLVQIAQALDVAVSQFFGTKASRSKASVHRVEQVAPEQGAVSNGYFWHLLAGGKPNDDLAVFHLVFPLKDRESTLVSHGGQEYCYVLRGNVRIIVRSKSFRLGPGEGILLHPQIPHRAESIDRAEAELLLVVTKSQHAEHFDWWTTRRPWRPR